MLHQRHELDHNHTNPNWWYPCWHMTVWYCTVTQQSWLKHSPHWQLPLFDRIWLTFAFWIPIPFYWPIDLQCRKHGFVLIRPSKFLCKRPRTYHNIEIVYSTDGLLQERVRSHPLCFGRFEHSGKSKEHRLVSRWLHCRIVHPTQARGQVGDAVSYPTIATLLPEVTKYCQDCQMMPSDHASFYNLEIIPPSGSDNNFTFARILSISTSTPASDRQHSCATTRPAQ